MQCHDGGEGGWEGGGGGGGEGRGRTRDHHGSN
jgi:hypothetical protein